MTTLIWQNPVIRSISVLPFSALITLVLLAGMYNLIKNEHTVFEEPVDTPRIPGVVRTPPPPLVNNLLKPERPEIVEVQPPMPKVSVEGPAVEVTVITSVVEKDFTTTVDLSSVSQLMPFIKIQPNYPQRAAVKGIEGFVDVVFDVNEVGSTENIRIVRAEPASIFDNSVIQAIKRWKYKPKTVEGKPAKTYDVRERISFEFEKNQNG